MYEAQIEIERTAVCAVQIVLHALVPRRSTFKKANLSLAGGGGGGGGLAGEMSHNALWCCFVITGVVFCVVCSDPGGGRVYVLMATYIM